jgi:ubiquinone/menaquinone biosynthesis C-methylase UbiE
MDARLNNEIAHGRHLAASGAASIWNWDSPAGRRRWARRAAWLCRGLGPGQKALELGCGTGLFTRELAKTGASVTAIDLSPELLELAKAALPAANVDWRLADACATGLELASFDFVLGSSVLHHLDLKGALAEAWRLLKPGGQLRFTEPNMLNPQIALQKNVPWIKRRMGDSPDETAFFRWSLRSRLSDAGFESAALRPFDFLHPALPGWSLDLAEPFCEALEKIPLLREIAGSLMIEAKKS